MNNPFASYQCYPYCFLLLASGILASALFGAVRNRRIGGGSRYLLLLLWAVAHWSFAAAFESAAMTVPLKLFWSQVASPAVVACPVLFFLFATRYSSPSGFPPRNWLPLLFALPIITIFFAFTHGRYHGLWADITIPAGTNLAVYAHGPWFFVNVTYSYILILAGAVLLIRRALRISPHFIPQVSVLVAGSAMPLLANAFYVFRTAGNPVLDLTPIAYLFSGMMLAIGIYRFGFLDLVPIARSLLVETMPDGVLVLDPRGIVVDLNPAMASLLGRRREEVFGQAVDEAFKDWKGIDRFFEGEEDRLMEAERVTSSGNKAFFDVQVSTLRDRRSVRRSSFMGRLLVFRDVTPRRQVEERLREAAFLDPLTGLANMRAAYPMLEEMVRRRRRDGMIFSLALLDIDRFKQINDTLGHQAGDEVLEEFSALVLRNAAQGQVSVRYGGDEFLLLFPDYCKREAEILLSGLLEEVHLSIKVDLEGKIPLGFSAGLIDSEDFVLPSELTVQAALELADARLYQAKAAGRNRLVANMGIGLKSDL